MTHTWSPPPPPHHAPESSRPLESPWDAASNEPTEAVAFAPMDLRQRPARPRRGLGRSLALVAGCLAAVPAVAVLVGGGVLAVTHAVATDDDGYVSATFERVDRPGVAVTTAELDGEGWPWVFDAIDVDLRWRVESADERAVFVGVARADDVARYLAGSARSEVTDIDDHTLTMSDTPGRSSVEPPAAQDFWTVSASGVGEQELSWTARGGKWMVVVMNADGSPGVAADVQLGARSDAVVPVAVTLIVLGALGLAVSITLIVVGARRRHAAEPLRWGDPLTSPE